MLLGRRSPQAPKAKSENPSLNLYPGWASAPGHCQRRPAHPGCRPARALLVRAAVTGRRTSARYTHRLIPAAFSFDPCGPSLVGRWRNQLSANNGSP